MGIKKIMLLIFILFTFNPSVYAHTGSHQNLTWLEGLRHFATHSDHVLWLLPVIIIFMVVYHTRILKTNSRPK